MIVQVGVDCLSALCPVQSKWGSATKNMGAFQNGPSPNETSSYLSNIGRPVVSKALAQLLIFSRCFFISFGLAPKVPPNSDEKRLDLGRLLSEHFDKDIGFAFDHLHGGKSENVSKLQDKESLFLNLSIPLHLLQAVRSTRQLRQISSPLITTQNQYLIKTLI